MLCVFLHFKPLHLGDQQEVLAGDMEKPSCSPSSPDSPRSRKGSWPRRTPWSSSTPYRRRHTDSPGRGMAHSVSHEPCVRRCSDQR
ncbi:unnamed protein product [Boreogadus saida]